eukprot:tig00020807_g14066.t1
MFKESTEMCLRALAAAGRPVPSSAAAQRLSFAWHYLRALLRRPPSEDDFVREAERARAGARADPEAAAMRREVSQLYSILVQTLMYMEYELVLNRYCIGQMVAMAFESPGVDERTAMGLSRAVQLCMFGKRHRNALRWAGLAWTVAKEIDSAELWYEITAPIMIGLYSSGAFATASGALVFLSEQARRSRNLTHFTLVCIWQALLAVRSTARRAHPKGLPGLAADLAGILDRAARNPDVVDNYSVSIGSAMLASCRLLMDEAPLAKAEVETLLASLVSGLRVSPPFRAGVSGIHAAAVFRALGPEGRASDGRTAARVALEAVGVARALPVDYAGRASPFAEYYFDAAVSTPGDPAPAASPLRAASDSPPPPPSAEELRAGVEAADVVLRRFARVAIARPLLLCGAGLARAARGDLRGARARFGEAARAAKGAGQPRDEGVATLLLAGHEADPGERRRLAAAAAALCGEAGDAFHARVATAMAEA